MCGIHLIWGKQANESAINRMAESSSHRGPDQQATLSPWPELWLAVNRLKVIHPGSEADQPFWAPDGKSLLIWNGEIYNFRELRTQLTQMGIVFTSQSDTEVLLQSLQLYGEKCLEKLEGTFALIYVDLMQKSILVARDRNGEKPLYYAHDKENLYISSEVRAINGLLKSQLNFNEIQHYFYLRSPSPDHTFFSQIKEWKAGTYGKIQSDLEVSEHPFTGNSSSKILPSKERFEKILKNILTQQFYAEVPVGVLLSGGCDSSLLYALWYRETKIALPAYTIALAQKYRKKYRDADSSIRFAKHYPIEHHVVEVTQQVFWDNWEEYVKSVDQPVGDSAGFLTWIIGKEAKREVKVLISGAGADELWGGYQRHKAIDFYLRNKKFITSIAPILKNVSLAGQVGKFFNAVQSDSKETFLNFTALQNLPENLHTEYRPEFDPNLSEYKQLLDFDRKNYLAQDVLKVQDNALMANGIEGRAPYLDQKMISLWENVTDDKCLKGKPWIKECLKELDLSWVVKRPKLGFGLPLKEWFAERGDFAKRVYNSLKKFEKMYGEQCPQEMRAMIANPESFSKTHFLTLYNLFLLTEWINLRQL